MPAMERPTLNVIGAGKVGKTLARLWNDAGVFAVQDVLNTRPASAELAIAFIGAGRAAAGPADLRPADAWMIATGDDAIERCCEMLVTAGALAGKCFVFHCSGALSSAVLQSAHAAGAAVGSLHPIRSFAEPASAATAFPGTWCGIEGDADSVALLTDACSAIGGRPVTLDGSHKTLYHTAAVLASNYVVTLLDTAIRAYAAAGIPEDTARQMLEPLVRGTLDNVFRLGPAAALTGPISRGDMATVQRQQGATRAWDAEAGALYDAFVPLTRSLAARK